MPDMHIRRELVLSNSDIKGGGSGGVGDTAEHMNELFNEGQKSPENLTACSVASSTQTHAGTLHLCTGGLSPPARPHCGQLGCSAQRLHLDRHLALHLSIVQLSTQQARRAELPSAGRCHAGASWAAPHDDGDRGSAVQAAQHRLEPQKGAAGGRERCVAVGADCWHIIQPALSPHTSSHPPV